MSPRFFGTRRYVQLTVQGRTALKRLHVNASIFGPIRTQAKSLVIATRISSWLITVHRDEGS